MDATVANCSILYPDLPWWRAPAAAARDGYRAVELWWPFDGPVAGDAQIGTLVAAVQDAEVRLVALNLFAGDLAAGERGLLSHPHRVSEVRENADCVAVIDRALGTRLHNVLYGERPGDDDLAAANLAHICATLRPVDAIPMLEPLSGTRPDYPIRTADQAVRVIDRLAADGHRVGLLADLYHLAANAQDIPATLRTHLGHLAHVQIADWPGRRRPGTGRLPLDAHLALLDELGYDGLVAAEHLPEPPA